MMDNIPTPSYIPCHIAKLIDGFMSHVNTYHSDARR